MIDDRFLSWLCLLPADTTIVPWQVPPATRELLADRLDHAGDTWLGWEPTNRDLPSLQHLQALVLVKPRGVSTSDLRTQGFSHIRSFTVVPRIDDARLFIPSHPRTAALRAWDLYTPFRGPARLQKIAARITTGTVGVAHLGDSVVLAQRELSPLENVLTRVVGMPDINIAIAPGPRRLHHKLSLQLSGEHGALLAYAKYGYGPGTAVSVEREARRLDSAVGLGLRSARVPELLYHGPFNDGYLLVSSPLPELSPWSPTKLTQQHACALRELAHHVGSKRTRDVVSRLVERTGLLAGLTNSLWHERLARAVAIVESMVAVGDLPTLLAHGDFTPWNLRSERKTGRLAIFDWEHSQTDQSPLWDAFHFNTQVDVLVRRRSPEESVAATLADPVITGLAKDLALGASEVAALFALYLTDIALQCFEDRQAVGRELSPWHPSEEQRMRMLELVVNNYLALSAPRPAVLSRSVRVNEA